MFGIRRSNISFEKNKFGCGRGGEGFVRLCEVFVKAGWMDGNGHGNVNTSSRNSKANGNWW